MVIDVGNFLSGLMVLSMAESIHGTYADPFKLQHDKQFKDALNPGLWSLSIVL